MGANTIPNVDTANTSIKTNKKVFVPMIAMTPTKPIKVMPARKISRVRTFFVLLSAQSKKEQKKQNVPIPPIARIIAKIFSMIMPSTS